MAPEVFLVSHTHWDREWYRTHQAFRARLVDTVDRVLDLLAEDPGYRFLLDGQAVILEDYLEVRPARRAELERAVREGRIEVGPWYVQPDSLLPSGEAHVRNLLEGRRVAGSFGPVSPVAYTPDSFGHPAQFPQLLRGFGLLAFVYWRGNGDEIADLPAEYRWVAPDGSEVLAWHLWRGYFNAAALPADPEDAAARLRPVVEELASRSCTGRVLLLNGSDHLPPDPHTGAVAQALARATGATVRRALLAEAVAGLDPSALPAFTGELLGGRVANLLPGVWSARTWLKLRNRRCEALLEGWAEPWAALGAAWGLPDERPALRAAWRSLLHNQAHDSICGCSQDAVHEQMRARYDAAEELARETTLRVAERLAGQGPERLTPAPEPFELAVFNPSPHLRTDVVRFTADPHHPFAGGEQGWRLHPLLVAGLRRQHVTVDGQPARLLTGDAGRAVQVVPERGPWAIEFVAQGVPPLGYRTVRVEAAAQPAADEEDGGTEVVAGEVRVVAEEAGTLRVGFGEASYGGLCGLEDVGDRGDTYDFDPVGPAVGGGRAEVRRFRHPSGIQRLEVRRTLQVPAGLTEDRTSRAPDTVELGVVVEARVAPGVARVDLTVRVDNTARDHRLRLLFPTGAPAPSALAATTFGVARRPTAPPAARGWRHPPPATFPHQGWVSCGGLTVVAPGLPEAEVTPEGVIAVTLLRAVGWLSRPDLRTRPEPAGPALPTPGAQCPGPLEARLALLPSPDPRAARDAELGLLAVVAGPRPLLPAGRGLLELEPPELLLSALKPAEEGEGIVLRVLNPTDRAIEATVRLGFPVSRAEAVRLDEAPSGQPVTLEGGVLRFPVPAQALRSVRLAP